MSCATSWDAHPHPTTGEPTRRYTDWEPGDLEERWKYNTTGRPLRSFIVCADRVEVIESWSFESGHALIYEDDPPHVVRRDDAAGLAAIGQRFGEPIATEIARAFFALGPAPS